LVWAALAGCVVGCGDEDNDGFGGSVDVAGPGVVVDPWTDYCVLTFTSDHEFIGPLDDVEFTARTGESYLVAAYRAFSGSPSVEIFYLTDVGPVEFELDLAGPPPFTSTCDLEAGRRLLGVFVDLTLYEDEELTREACQLPAGTTIPFENSQGSGYAIAGEVDLFGSGPTTYKLFFDALSERCGGLEELFVSARQKTVGSTTYTIVPVRLFMAPPEPLDG
jgi:hypothetical protein